jgi:phage terminase large subunit-like protein
MTPATARFYEAVVNGQVSHSGDSRLARHIGNAVLREDSRGARLAKERKDSPRRIDAAVMTHDRAAALAGAVRDSIYI